MKATAFEFRFRFLIHFVIIFLGFTAPWDRWLPLDAAGPNAHVWGTLSAHLAMLKPGVLNIATAFNLLLTAGILCALAAALLCTWGSAYLGANVVKAHTMQGQSVVADGPYRRLRNPLYLGTFIHIFALALLMPPSGAIFSIVLVGLFQLRLIFGEEAFLTQVLGEPYVAYRNQVPSLLPSLTPRVPATPIHPQWGSAFLGEIYFWGAAVSFAALGWRYNSLLIIQGVVVSVGISIVARAFLPKERNGRLPDEV